MNTQSITELPTITSFQKNDKMLVARMQDGLEQTYVSHGITYSDLSNSISADIAKIKVEVAIGDSLVALKGQTAKAPSGRLFWELDNTVKNTINRVSNLENNTLPKSSTEVQKVTTPVYFSNSLSANTPTNDSHVATKAYVDSQSSKLLFSQIFHNISLSKVSLLLQDLAPLEPGTTNKDYTVFVTYRLTSNTKRVPKIEMKNGDTALTVTKYEGTETLTKTERFVRYYCQMSKVDPEKISIILTNAASDVQVDLHIYSGLVKCPKCG